MSDEHARLTVALDEQGGEARHFYLCISRRETQRLDANARRALRSMLVDVVDAFVAAVEGGEGGEG